MSQERTRPATSRIQSEIRQKRPFRTRRQEAAIALLRTADVVRRRVASVVEAYGVTPQQYNVLRIIAGAGQDGIPTLDIAERMIERTPGITRLLDRLEARKLVRRERCPSDRRQVLCWLTGAGEELLRKMRGPIDQADHIAVGKMGEAELERLITLLDTVRGEGE
jgi:DNA-binding MarR family transcriptional regulator